MSCQRVRDIREHEKAEPIEVRVIKKWITKGKREEICYQFVDAYGGCIEASAELRHIEYFDSVIQLNSCYRVTEYVCVGPRTYMATVDHAASLVIGQKAKFTPILGSNIPTFHFNFANYDILQARIKNPKLLTDYIGRVEKNSLRTTRTGKTIRKTLLRDQSGHQVELTFWPEKKDLIGDNVVPGNIIAITSTMVTEYSGALQLESTYLTTAVINPELPQTQEHVNRLRTLPAMQENRIDERMVTIQDLRPNNPLAKESLKGTTNLTCRANITQIHEERGWYYVSCSKCSSKMYRQHADGHLIFICKDENDVTPIFKYSVNATITDATGRADVVFFNDSMYAMLQITCSDMVTKHGETNPKKLPHFMASIMNRPWLLHLAQKIDGSIVVNDVTEVATSTNEESETPIPTTSTFTPTTPAPKKTASKRQDAITPDASDRKKAKKA
ncbi:hypothetical protein CASFOL_028910 [Castilleja foliolosa]|uniref:Replication factor A C-terminal domain-containing protein n=1 Tax=Castilleja foliolosa TaxID=1961234 RepID=A0ABD3CDD4_9LAMI